MADFLLEVGLEEVPARMLAPAQAELGERVRALLERERLLTAEAEVTTYSTPRRLAVLVRGVAAKQADAEEVLTGPAWAIAFKEGAPTPAAHAFAKKAGVAVEQLQPVTTAKGEYVSARVARPGRKAVALLAELVPHEIGLLSWPKPMYWRAGKPERFVRPVQWLVALLDQEVVPVNFAGIHASRKTYGHRILHGKEPAAIASSAAYVETLLSVHVMADVKARRHRIRKELDRVTRTMPNARWREDEALVDTVTHLTEWPSIVLGSFAPEYLALPEEVLVTVMRDHQKYFAVEDKQGKLLPHFLTVLNTVTDERGEAVIRHGNERVLRARFSDARFFWDFDQKMPLSERLALLEKVTFQKDLGSYRKKTERTLEIARKLATVIRRGGITVDQQVLMQAVELAKVDLTTELVKEFTELQGVIGGLYARAEGLGEPVAQAIYWQYRPAAITDAIPPTVEGQILSLADRIGTIVDLFKLGLAPSGSRDPYALRRAANGVVRILALSKLPIKLSSLMSIPLEEHTNYTPETAAIRPFMLERLAFYMREVCALPADVVAAVMAADPLFNDFSSFVDDVPDVIARAESINTSKHISAIVAAWKRIKNILKKEGISAGSWGNFAEPKRFEAEAEITLWEVAGELAPKIDELHKSHEYLIALELIAQLRPALDIFFDTVRVDDPEHRDNRIAMLQGIYLQFSRIADFSELNSTHQESRA